MTGHLEVVFQRWFVVECKLTGGFAGGLQPFQGGSTLLGPLQGLEGSQCQGAGQQVAAEPLVLNNCACENFHPSLDWRLQLMALPEREGLNKDSNSV